MNVLVHGAPEVLPDLFHVIPAGIGDPFLYLETPERRAATVTVLDADSVRPHGVEILDPISLGIDELIAAGYSRAAIEGELAVRACRELGIADAVVPPAFPLLVADRLREDGIVLTPDAAPFAARRRAKTPAQLAGIRRAQRAADAAMGVAAALIHELRGGLTAEAVRAAMQAEAARHGCELPDDVIVAPGAQGAAGHESGRGPIEAGVGVVVDIWPRDRESRCWADMTRTFVAGAGEPDEELRRFWELAHASLELVRDAIRPGLDATELFALSCEPFHAAGVKTQLSKASGEKLEEGYFHSLGHGVGLEIHEAPGLGRIADTLVEGDVLAVEPGCYRLGYGGCRLEDLVLVTAGGGETLTDFPYEL